MEFNLESNTSTSDKSRQITEGKTKMNIKKVPKKEKLTVFRDDLNQQRSLFTNVLKFVNDERKDHENNFKTTKYNSVFLYSANSCFRVLIN